MHEVSNLIGMKLYPNQLLSVSNGSIPLVQCSGQGLVNSQVSEPTIIEKKVFDFKIYKS
jgi:hypothetical protein